MIKKVAAASKPILHVNIIPRIQTIPPQIEVKRKSGTNPPINKTNVSSAKCTIVFLSNVQMDVLLVKSAKNEMKDYLQFYWLLS